MDTFDHLLHWVPDLDEAIARFTAHGFVISPGGRHPGGTRNASWASRHTGAYVELLTVEAWRERRACARAGGGGPRRGPWPRTSSGVRWSRR